jgi:pimeloyl-ACP methyl ester carboxylesterase
LLETDPATLPHVQGVEHRLVAVNGVRLHVAQAGAGDPLVLLHGWPQHWYMWRHQLPPLAHRYSVFAPDFRGFGWSEAPPFGYEKENLVDDILALMDTLGLERIRLMGHDWGAWVGFLLCLRAPDRVERFLAMGVPHPFVKPDSRLRDSWRYCYQFPISGPLADRWLFRWPTGLWDTVLKRAFVNQPPSDPEIAAYTARLREPARARASVRLYRTFLLREVLPVWRGRYRAARLLTPTLLIFGSHDPAVSLRLVRGYEPYADALDVEVIPHCGHFAPEEIPKLVTDRALGFFGGAPSARSPSDPVSGEPV